MKTDFFFQKLLFSTSIKKLKMDFFYILIIFKKLSKYMKSGKKKKYKQTYHKQTIQKVVKVLFSKNI